MSEDIQVFFLSLLFFVFFVIISTMCLVCSYNIQNFCKRLFCCKKKRRIEDIETVIIMPITEDDVYSSDGETVIFTQQEL